MSAPVTVKCPDYESGMCTRHGCEGLLARPCWTGQNEDGSDLYAASCAHGPELFRGLKASAPEAPTSPLPVQKPRRHYRTRTMITLDRAADLTGFGKRTIQNLEKNPRDTKFPGLNVEEYVLVGWALKYSQDKVLARWANRANHPIPISSLPDYLQKKLGF